MYAIVEIAGQQFKVAKDQKLFVHRLADKEGSKVSFDKVFLLDDGKKVSIGAPAITGASVDAKVINHLKDDKVIVFKKKRRKGYRVKNGHRQSLTELVIEKINVSEAKSKLAQEKSDKAAQTKTEKNPAVKKAATKKAQTTDFSKLTVSQLKYEAKKKGLEGIASMKKADLIAALSK